MNVYQQYTDQELTDFLKSGDQQAYTQIYDRYQALLYIYACKITKDENEAEDLVQEVFFIFGISVLQYPSMGLYLLIYTAQSAISFSIYSTIKK